MLTKLFWIDGPWTGRLALAARPRGGEWLEDEMAAWSKAGVGAVFSLLTPEEESSLGLEQEAATARIQGIQFLSFPVEDRQVPGSPSELAKAIDWLKEQLRSGKNAVVHCRQGVGRSGLAAACLLVSNGLDPQTAVARLSAARGVPVPETVEQRRWIDYYAGSFAGTR